MSCRSHWLDDLLLPNHPSQLRNLLHPLDILRRDHLIKVLLETPHHFLLADPARGPDHLRTRLPGPQEGEIPIFELRCRHLEAVLAPPGRLPGAVKLVVRRPISAGLL